MISASDIAYAFPEAHPGIKPLGSRVLVQLRLVRERTAGGIFIAPETREFNEAIGQFAKVLALGPLAFRNRNTGEVWPEGLWASVGDIVRVPKYGGDRMCKKTADGNIIFVLFDDNLITGAIEAETMSSLDELL